MLIMRWDINLAIALTMRPIIYILHSQMNYIAFWHNASIVLGKFTKLLSNLLKKSKIHLRLNTMMKS